MVFDYNDSTKEIGNDVMLDVGGSGSEVPITNASFSEEAETSEVQLSTGLNKDIAVSGVTYSGSFEVAGRNNSLRDQLWESRSGGMHTVAPKYKQNITIIDGSGREYTFTNVLITSHSKDIPADDRTTESYDFTAEKLYITGGGGTQHTTEPHQHNS